MASLRSCLFLLTLPLLAQDAGLEHFEKKVRPVLAQHCYACHSGNVKMGGLDLQTGVNVSSFVVRGDPQQSRLYSAVTYGEKVKMPPSGKLGAEAIASIREWIGLGADWPNAPVTAEKKLTTNHWAFQPVRNVVPPKVKNEAWVQTNVDRFVLAKLEAQGLKPAGAVSKLALLRRVTYDLTGLPPSLEEIDAFLKDESKQAYAKVVDKLLASPRYGERWGRHWLDVARYADSTGMDEDHIYPYAWRYRDYVVNAFNADLPFNQFVQEQIAGDLMTGPERKQERTVATGFLALGPKPLAQQDRIKMIYDVVDEQIDTVSKALLGLTVSCARCHDHKFDPILTKDYYGLASIFASTQSFRNLGRPGSVSYLYNAPLDAGEYGMYQAHRWRTYSKRIELEDAAAEDATRENLLLRPKIAEYLVAAWKAQHLKKPTAALAEELGLERRLLDRWVDLAKKDADYWRTWREATEETIAAVAKNYQITYDATATKWDTQLSNWRRRYAQEVAADRDLPERPKFDGKDNSFFAATTFGGPMELTDSPRVAQLRAEYAELERTMPAEPAMASAVTDGPSIQQRIFTRGDHLNPGEPVGKQFLTVMTPKQPHDIKGSGRMELAAWLTDRSNPLTARVFVNRVWQGHFGEALVRTANNWGTTGEKPSHPELLDYLATQFVEQGWSVKALHRTILLSNAYRMSTTVAPEAKQADPSNRLLSRFPRARMSVEQIRDSFLVLDGSLDGALGGPMLPSGKMKRPKVEPDDMTRRTLYIPVRRGSIPTVLATFDYGDATTSSDGRPRTNVAPQALFMMNSKYVVEHAKGFADRLLTDESLTDSSRIDRAYLLALTRKAEPQEVDRALSYIASMAQKLGGNDARAKAWQSFCHVLMSSNEFVFLP